jgi:hypothetical protein
MERNDMGPVCKHCGLPIRQEPWLAPNGQFGGHRYIHAGTMSPICKLTYADPKGS